MGEREWNVLRAAAAISAFPGTVVESLSPLYETEPEGDGFSSSFINAAVLISTSLTPAGLLRFCQETEKRFGRLRNKIRKDRVIDLDIITYADLVLDSTDLVLPHPRCRERLFVLMPVRDIAPGLLFPPDMTIASDLIRNAESSFWIRRISSRNVIYNRTS